MQVIRTVLWIAITAILVAFITMNWTKVPINFWPLDDGNYVHFEWPVGILALLFFVLGVFPTWLYLRAVRWRLNRRIAALENSLRASSMSTTASAPEAAPSSAVLDGPSSSPSPEP